MQALQTESYFKAQLLELADALNAVSTFSKADESGSVAEPSERQVLRSESDALDRLAVANAKLEERLNRRFAEFQDDLKPFIGQHSMSVLEADQIHEKYEPHLEVLASMLLERGGPESAEALLPVVQLLMPLRLEGIFDSVWKLIEPASGNTPEIRRKAVELIFFSKGFFDLALPRLVDALEKEDLSTVHIINEKLPVSVKFPWNEFIPQLIAKVEDSSKSIEFREECIFKLGINGIDPSVIIPKLIEWLERDEGKLSERAGHCLGWILGREISPDFSPLLKFVETGSEQAKVLALEAVRPLFSKHQKAIENLYLKALENGGEAVKLQVIAGLVENVTRISRKNCMPWIVLRNGYEISNEVQEALTNLNSRYRESQKYQQQKASHPNDFRKLQREWERKSRRDW